MVINAQQSPTLPPTYRLSLKVAQVFPGGGHKAVALGV